MGLDIYHLKPIEKIMESLDYLEIEDFEDNPEYLRRHAHLLTEMETPIYGLEFILFPNEIVKKIVLDKVGDYSRNRIFVGNLDTIKCTLDKISSNEGVLNTVPFIYKNTITDMPHLYYHSISYITHIELRKVLYYKEMGYLRKRMNKVFYNDFINNKMYYDKQSVSRAYKHLTNVSGETLVDIQKYFCNNFIDNFSEGESIFYASW